MTNETQETEEQRNERYTAHLDEYFENPLVRSVLSEDTSFVEEVEDFYDITAKEAWTGGYNTSGYGAHEAEISFMNERGFDEKDIMFMDELRRFRNQINYEGKKFDKEYAEKVIEFTNLVCLELKIIITKNK